MTVYVRKYQKNGETQAVVLDSPDQYAVVMKADKGALKGIYVFDGQQRLAAKYTVEGDKMRAEGYGKTAFGGAFAAKSEATLTSTDHSHLYLETMNGGSPFDMSWEKGRLSLYFGENEMKTVGALHLDWEGKMKPYLEEDSRLENPVKELNFVGDGKDNLWMKKVAELTAKKGMAKRLNEITLEKKAEVLDQEVEKDRQEDAKLIKEYLEVGAARGTLRGDLKTEIMKVKNKTEKKRFEKYKKMSAAKLAEMRAKKEGR